MPTHAKLIWWHMLSPTPLIWESKLEGSLSRQSSVSPGRDRVQSHKVPCCQYSVAALTCPIQKCPIVVSVLWMSFPCLFKAVFTDTISWRSTPVTSHWFQFNPWLTFKNTVPFQSYLSFIPSSAPHIKQSDLLSLWFKNQKNTFECLTLYPWAHCLHPEYSFCPHNTCIYRTNSRCSSGPTILSLSSWSIS